MHGMQYQSIYTPESPEFKDSDNEALAGARATNWYFSRITNTTSESLEGSNDPVDNDSDGSHESKQDDASPRSVEDQDTFFKDFRRVSKKRSLEENVEAVTKLLQGSNVSLDTLEYHYSQSLTSFPLMVLLATFPEPLKTNVIVKPIDRVDTHQEGDQGLTFKTEYLGLEYLHMLDGINIYIPGKITISFVLFPTGGFLLQELSYSNHALKYFGLAKKEALLSRTELRTKICLAYEQEITMGLDDYRNRSNANQATLLIFEQLNRAIQMNTIDVLNRKIAKPLQEGWRMSLKKILQQPWEEPESDSQYAEHLSDLLYHCPAARFFCEGMLSLEEQYASAAQALDHMLQALSENDLRKAPGLALLHKTNQVKTENPQDLVLLTQVLWETKRLLKAPGGDEQKENYQQLMQAVSQQPYWGKVIAGAMLGLAFAVIAVLCCTGTFGLAGLPLLAWGLSELAAIAVIASSAIISALSFVGFFAQGIAQNNNLKDLSQEMNTVFSAPKPS